MSVYSITCVENENGNNVFGTYVRTNSFHCFAKEWPFLILSQNYGAVCVKSMCCGLLLNPTSSFISEILNGRKFYGKCGQRRDYRNTYDVLSPVLGLFFLIGNFDHQNNNQRFLRSS